jgi:hypothetical protein
VRQWSRTYDLVVRLTPDVEIRADGVRSTNDRFRDEIEAILDARLPRLVPRDRLIIQPASGITESHDWWPLALQLAKRLGEPLLADGVSEPTRPVPRATARGRRRKAAAQDQLALDLGR